MNANLEALWAVHFGDVSDPNHSNGGVVVFETLRVFGGDSSFYYSGEYKASGETIRAQIKITHYSGDNMTAFGAQIHDSLQIRMKGRRDGSKIRGEMWRVDSPGKRLPLILVHLEDLPNP